MPSALIVLQETLIREAIAPIRKRWEAVPEIFSLRGI